MIGNTQQSRQRKSRLLADIQNILVHGAVLLLMLVGVGGVLYKSLRPGGWLSHVAGGLATGGVWSILFGLGAILGAATILRQWLSEPDGRGSRGDILLYAAMGLGVFFTFELLVNGSL